MIATDREARTDHLLYHTRRPQSACELCIEDHERSRQSWLGSTRCTGSWQIVTGKVERTDGNGAWARMVCPECGRRVGASRPTQRKPWITVGLHGKKTAA